MLSLGQIGSLAGAGTRKVRSSRQISHSDSLLSASSSEKCLRVGLSIARIKVVQTTRFSLQFSIRFGSRSAALIGCN